MPQTGCPVGAMCFVCHSATGLRQRIDRSPAGEVYWTACEAHAVGWAPLRLSPPALVGLAREHGEHLGMGSPQATPRSSPRQIGHMELPDVLFEPAEAAELLGLYFHAREMDYSGPLYTGGQFERFAGRGDHPDVVNRFTAEDLVAVSMLSVHGPSRAA